MELELGFKITRIRDDITSSSGFQLAKDPAGPLFLSRETESMFILTAHLKGYRRENIGIKINEDGSKITIKGEKPVQEMMMKGWIMFMKEVEIRGFGKVFKIPEGVVLDEIKAKYEDEESILTIFMPKLVKGILGVGVEEVKEEEWEASRGKPELEPSVRDGIQGKNGRAMEEESKGHEIGKTEREKVKVEETAGVSKGKEVIKTKAPTISDEEHGREEKVKEGESETIESIKQKAETSQEITEADHHKESKNVTAVKDAEYAETLNTRPESTKLEKFESEETLKSQTLEQPTPVKPNAEEVGFDVQETTIKDELPGEQVVHESTFQESENQKSVKKSQKGKDRSKKCKLCAPVVIVGSAFLISLTVIMFHQARPKRK